MLTASKQLSAVRCHKPFSAGIVPRQVRCAAGFGKSNKKKIDTSGGSYTTAGRRRVDIAEEISGGKAKTQQTSAGAVPKPDTSAGWIDVADQTLFSSKNVKPVILATGKAVMLYQYNGKVYCSDANSTAFEYPLTDAKIVDTPEGPVIEVPLDGTQYFLETGKVKLWCPRDSAMRKFLGTLKQVVNPIDLKMYPVITTDDGKIWTKFL
jgi:nitrite reductase/ring-hydroxylating ferredoxin subunit